MARPSEDDRADIDRAFEQLVAGFHLTAEGHRADERVDPSSRIDPLPDASTDADQEVTADSPRPSGTEWVDVTSTFRFAESAPPPEPPPADEINYQPEDDLPPLRRPGIPALVGWIGMAYGVLVLLAGSFGAHFPVWAAWLAIAGFIGGFGVLVSRLPRHRPPGSGDGAVV